MQVIAEVHPGFCRVLQRGPAAFHGTLNTGIPNSKHIIWY